MRLNPGRVQIQYRRTLQANNRKICRVASDQVRPNGIDIRFHTNAYTSSHAKEPGATETHALYRQLQATFCGTVLNSLSGRYLDVCHR